MSFAFGSKSIAKLQGVHPKLVRVFESAIAISEVDFGIHDGLRSEAQQREYVRSGVSQTMNSMHRKQPDGFGYAVDAVPYINGQLRWEWPPIYKIAAAVRIIACEQGVGIRWGGCWRSITDIGPGSAAMEQAVEAYGAARRAAGKKVFTDGPHYELMS